MVNHSKQSKDRHLGKPVFMTDLQMHWYMLCDDILVAGLGRDALWVAP